MGRAATRACSQTLSCEEVVIPVMTTEHRKYEFPIKWDDCIVLEALHEQLMRSGLECSTEIWGLPWVWERVAISVFPLPNGIGLLSVKDFRQGVHSEEQTWFATRLNMLQLDALFYPRDNQLIAESQMKSQGLPATGDLISHIARFERACLLADGPLIEGLLQNA